MQDLTFNQYLALLTAADVFMVTSVREGMALRAHEYVICQEGIHHPLILSEVGTIQSPYIHMTLNAVSSLVHRQLQLQRIPIVHCCQSMGQERHGRRHFSGIFKIGVVVSSN